MTHMGNGARSSLEYSEAEAREDRRERDRRNRERFVPYRNRPTARPVVDDRVEIRGEFEGRSRDYPVAFIAAHRHRHGISIDGSGSLEQLKELRDALNARIAQEVE